MNWKKFIFNLENSFKNNELGYSGRKLSGFTSMGLVVILIGAYIWLSVLDIVLPEFVSVLVILLTFTALCHAIFTLDQLSRFRSSLGSMIGKKTVIETPDTTVTTTENREDAV